MSGQISASAIILAGGRSSRMGTPKEALDFGGVTILQRIVDELTPLFAEVLVVGAPQGKIEVSSVRLLHDETAFAGPLDALRRGLVASSNQIAFACSCDLPLLKADLATGLCAMLETFEAAIPTVNGHDQPLCAAYRKDAASKIAAILDSGDKRMQTLVSALNTRSVVDIELRRFDPDLRSFMNVNTPADYAKALALLKTADEG